MPRCAHDQDLPAPPPAARSAGCEECLGAGSAWSHLRRCLTCGHLGCCDSSPGQHARRHFESTRHPLIQSAEPGEDWRWCYVDRTYLDE